MENKKVMLENVKQDFTKMWRDGDCEVVIFKRYNGSKAGVGNSVMIKKLIEAVLRECEDQLKSTSYE